MTLFDSDPALAYAQQAAAQQYLARLLAAGRRAGLLPLLWLVGETGALTGCADAFHCDAETGAGPSAAQARAAVEGWARLLGAGPVIEHPADRSGTVRLDATTIRTVGGTQIGVRITAALYPGVA